MPTGFDVDTIIPENISTTAADFGAEMVDFDDTTHDAARVYFEVDTDNTFPNPTQLDSSVDIGLFTQNNQVLKRGQDLMPDTDYFVRAQAKNVVFSDGSLFVQNDAESEGFMTDVYSTQSRVETIFSETVASDLVTQNRAAAEIWAYDTDIFDRVLSYNPAIDAIFQESTAIETIFDSSAAINQAFGYDYFLNSVKNNNVATELSFYSQAAMSSIFSDSTILQDFWIANSSGNNDEFSEISIVEFSDQNGGYLRVRHREYETGEFADDTTSADYTSSSIDFTDKNTLTVDWRVDAGALSNNRRSAGEARIKVGGTIVKEFIVESVEDGEVTNSVEEVASIDVSGISGDQQVTVEAFAVAGYDDFEYYGDADIKVYNMYLN